ncbi:RNI-like superfamily protein [Forsythia ovata]|uniref:RNI-like superfamily protein n=1 Tax=Forsythia ovata TaxID=205694 RepID=A0ABD1X4I4_9LAMI
MNEVPTLIQLCAAAIRDELLHGDSHDDILPGVYELPPELFDVLLPQLPPLALQKLHENLPFEFRDDYELANGYCEHYRKRGRCGIVDSAWRALYKSRWPGLGQKSGVMVWLDKHEEEKYSSVVDWQQIYWETHLQNCVDAITETALLPSYGGCIGEIQIPDSILQYIGCKGHPSVSTSDYLKFSYHCQQFGIYVRCLRLPNVLCVMETCHLLQISKLESLNLQWIKSIEHVEGLCKLVNQNSETLKSVEFTHCKFYPTFMDAICDSLHVKGHKTHGIEHFSIKRSSFLQTDTSTSLPVGLTSILKSGRSLRSLSLCDNQLQTFFAKNVFNTLLDTSASISNLDLSENNISGWLSHFKWGSGNQRVSFGIGKSLQSLHLLNLRNNNLQKDDADCLKHALVHMPNLQNLDISDNPIEDDGIKSLFPYFIEMSGRPLPFSDLKLENCELTCDGVSQLLEVLSTMKTPLKMLSVGDNDLGSKMGRPLGKFMCTGIRALNIEDIGLRSSGFLEVLQEIKKEMKLVYINISKNRGGIGSAKFLSKLIFEAKELVAVDAQINFMPMESLSVIASSLKVTKGKLELLDLTGNSFGEQLADESVLAEFRVNGKLILKMSSSVAPNTPYDDDP